MGVELRHHERTARPGGLDRSGEHVDLDAERDSAPARAGGVQDDDIGRAGAPEQARDEREARREVVEGREVARTGPDEGGLVEHAVADRDTRLGVQEEQAVAGECLVDHAEQVSRGGKVPGGDHAGRGSRDACQACPEHGFGDDAHGASMPARGYGRRHFSAGRHAVATPSPSRGGAWRSAAHRRALVDRGHLAAGIRG